MAINTGVKDILWNTRKSILNKSLNKQKYYLYQIISLHKQSLQTMELVCTLSKQSLQTMELVCTHCLWKQRKSTYIGTVLFPLLINPKQLCTMSRSHSLLQGDEINSFKRQRSLVFLLLSLTSLKICIQQSGVMKAALVIDHSQTYSQWSNCNYNQFLTEMVNCIETLCL